MHARLNRSHFVEVHPLVRTHDGAERSLPARGFSPKWRDCRSPRRKSCSSVASSTFFALSSTRRSGVITVVCQL